MITNLLVKIQDRLKNRADTEHIQVYVRLGGGGLWLFYLLWADSHYEIPRGVLFFAYVYLVVSLLIFVWILYNPKISMLRRSVGIILDASCINYSIFYAGQAGAPLLAAYLTTAFGYGFRYGNAYLFISSTISVIGFSYISLNSPYWSSQPVLSASLLFTLIILSICINAGISIAKSC